MPRVPNASPVLLSYRDVRRGPDRRSRGLTLRGPQPHPSARAAIASAFYADVKGRLARYGRTPDQLLVLPAATFVLGDTDTDARERAHAVRLQQVSGQTAIRHLEQLWNRDLSAYDPDGPLPDVDPIVGENTIAKGWASTRMQERGVFRAEYAGTTLREHLGLAHPDRRAAA